MSVLVDAEIGLGTSPSHPIVVGGVFRSLTHLFLGTDVSLSGRIATSGFARGEWGAALDVGVAGRWWEKQQYGHFPLQIVGILGGKEGLQLEAGAQFLDVSGDSPTAKGGFVLLALDIFRVATAWSGSQRSFFGSEPPPTMQVTEHDFSQPQPSR